MNLVLVYLQIILMKDKAYLEERRSLKKELITLVEGQLIQLSEKIKLLEEARDAETKSSVGDKYETTRSLLQSEIAKLHDQFTRKKEDLKVCKVLDVDSSNYPLKRGSLIRTNKSDFFISIPLGRINLDGKKYYAISVSAPLVKQMKGKSSGDHFSFRGQNYEIL